MEAAIDSPTPRIAHMATRKHDVQILSLTPSTSGPLRAFVDVQIGSSLIIYGAKVIQQVGQSAWVAMPSREYTAVDGTRKFVPIVKLSGDLKRDVEEAILQAWQSEVAS
jgi:DNA-binding cell septation regulator SpoVG